MNKRHSFYEVSHTKNDVAAFRNNNFNDFKLQHSPANPTELPISAVKAYYFWCYTKLPLRWEEAVRVESAARSLRDRLIIRLCLFSGLRAHEVADACIEHVDPISGWIYIPHGHKSGPRIAAVDSKTLKLLALYVGERRRGPLFHSKQGPGITRYTVYHVVTRTAKRSNIVTPKTVNPLMLRHCFATTWLRKKGNIRRLQKQLGHIALQSTAYYLDWLPDEVKAEHSRLFDILEPVEKWRARIRSQFKIKER